VWDVCSVFGIDFRDAEFLADVPPLLAEIIRVAQRSRRGREDHCLFAQVRQAAADSKHFDRELGYGHRAPASG